MKLIELPDAMPCSTDASVMVAVLPCIPFLKRAMAIHKKRELIIISERMIPG